MRLHRFFVREPIGPKKEVSVHSDELVNQISRVFRLKSGDPVILFDGSGNDYESVIRNYDKQTVTFAVVTSVPSRFVPTRTISLCAAVVKKDTFEWIAEKATELGVTKIIPVVAERSEKKNLNEERLKKIVIEASEQCGRGTVPEIHPIISLKESLEWVKENGISAIVFHTEGEAFDRTKLHANNNPLEVFIGPEGGWSAAEVEMFHTNKIPIVSLGTQVLRAETAVVAALSLTVL